MNVWRYQTSESLEIDAPVEAVYAVASDPAAGREFFHAWDAWAVGRA